MKRNLLLMASVLGAAAFLAWLAWVTPRTTAVTSAGPARVAAADSSSFAVTPATAPPPSTPAPAEAPRAGAGLGTPPTAPPEVQEVTDRRQFAKITRGMRSNPEGGILIDAAPAGSVAQQMHLQPGDVLKAVNNEAVSSPEDFARIYRAEGVPGEFVVIRDGREMHRR